MAGFKEGDRLNSLTEKGKIIPFRRDGNKQGDFSQIRDRQPRVARKSFGETIGAINADQSLSTFVAELLWNKDRLISLARKLQLKREDTPLAEENNLALGIYLDVALKEPFLTTIRHEIKPGEYLDKKSNELTVVERMEVIASWATERTAFNWLTTHPDSEAAKEVMEFNIYGYPDQHHRLLKEMWPEILPKLASKTKKKK